GQTLPPGRGSGGGGLPPPALMLVDDHTPDVLAVEQVLIDLVDLFQTVSLRDQLVQLDIAAAVQVEHLLDVVDGVGGTEEGALDTLLEQGQDRPVQVDGLLHEVAETGHGDGSALADHVEGRLDDVLLDHPDCDDGVVGADAGGQLLPDELDRPLGGGSAVGGPQLLGLLPLVRQGVDCYDVLRARVASALDRVDADAADAVDHHRLARLDAGCVDGRTPAGR